MAWRLVRLPLSMLAALRALAGLPGWAVAWVVRTLGGAVRRDALLLDAEAAVAFALSKNGLGLRRQHVLVVGHSIGGAVGAIVAARQRLALCSSRSFAKLSSVVGVHGASMLNILPVPWPWPLSLLPQAVCRALCVLSGWELDAASAWSMNAKFKWTECSTADRIVPFPLSLHLTVIKQVGCVDECIRGGQTGIACSRELKLVGTEVVGRMPLSYIHA